jgi:hypothetical protein
VLGVLRLLNASRCQLFFRADASIRDKDEDSRDGLAEKLQRQLLTLKEHPYRWFTLLGDEPLMFWLQKFNYVAFIETHGARAEAAAITVKASQCLVIFIYVALDGSMSDVSVIEIAAPT